MQRVEEPGLAEQFGKLDLPTASPRAPRARYHTQLFLIQDLRVQVFFHEWRGYPTQHQVETPLAQLAKFRRGGDCLIDMKDDPRVSLQ